MQNRSVLFPNGYSMTSSTSPPTTLQLLRRCPSERSSSVSPAFPPSLIHHRSDSAPSLKNTTDSPQSSVGSSETLNPKVSGEFETVPEALFQITSRLQEHFLHDAFPSMNRPSNHRFLDHIPPFPSYMGRRELPPVGMYPSMGPSFHQFDAVGDLPPRGGFHSHDDRPPYMHNFHRSGIRPPVSERMPSFGPWVPQGLIDGGGPMGLPDYAAGPQRKIGGFRGASPAIITSTKVEVVVPRSVVPEIYGEGGGCLRQICEISDAKVTINDPKPGVTEAVIIISGTPEQTNAARSLIQAFVMLKTEAP